MWIVSYLGNVPILVQNLLSQQPPDEVMSKALKALKHPVTGTMVVYGFPAKTKVLSDDVCLYQDNLVSSKGYRGVFWRPHKKEFVVWDIDLINTTVEQGFYTPRLDRALKNIGLNTCAGTQTIMVNLFRNLESNASCSKTP